MADCLDPQSIPSLSLYHLLLGQASLTPSNAALLSPSLRLSYSRLLEILNDRAREVRDLVLLSTGIPLRPDTPVAVVGDNSVEDVVCSLAVVTAGAAYLPLDSSWPVERLRYQMQQAACPLALSSLPLSHQGVVPFSISLGLTRTEPLRCINSTIDAAYVIYTSGTTGKPKGVVSSHRGILNMLVASARNFYLTPKDRIYSFTHFVFDNSVLEIFAALSNGAALYLRSERQFEFRSFLDSLAAEKITHALLFPGVVAAFNKSQLSELRKLRYWIVGAEKASKRLIDEAIELGISVIQNYGPTETTTYALCRHMKRGDHPNNLGEPIPNMKIKVGEGNRLLISGAGLMRGYLGGEIADTFVDGFYDSGDVVRIERDGSIVFIGRTDSQVKIRGYRVELGEIENVLMEIVQQAKVTVEKNQIIAHHASETVTEQLCCDHCSNKLPSYMVPNKFIRLDSFPLTPNAKIDIAKLQEEAPKRKQIAEGSITDEEKLEWILKTKLNLPLLSFEDNFFEIGGNSIIAIRICAEVENVFGVRLRSNELFEIDNFFDLLRNIREQKDQRGDRRKSSNIRPVRHYQTREQPIEEPKIATKNDGKMAKDLRNIWRRVLDSSDEFVESDHFFLFGGDSLKLIHLQSAINVQFGTHIRIQDIMDNLEFGKARSSVIKQLSLVSSAHEALASSISLKIIANPPYYRDTLILIHALFGGVSVPYRNLIEELAPTHRILGMEYPDTFDNVTTNADNSTSITRLATVYARQLLPQLPEAREIVMVGASLGGLIAFETARVLLDRSPRLQLRILNVDGASDMSINSRITKAEHDASTRKDLSDRGFSSLSPRETEAIIEGAWNLLQMAVKHTPKRDERIRMSVFSLCGSDLGWTSFSDVQSVYKLRGKHVDILNKQNVETICTFL